MFKGQEDVITKNYGFVKKHLLKTIMQRVNIFAKQLSKRFIVTIFV